MPCPPPPPPALHWEVYYKEKPLSLRILAIMTGFWMEGINLLSLWEFKVPNFWKSECFFFISIFIIIIIIIIIVIIIIIIITSNIGKSKL